MKDKCVKVCICIGTVFMLIVIALVGIKYKDADLNLIELDDSSQMIDIEKDNEIIYILTKDNKLYVNGTNASSNNDRVFGFESNFWYNKRIWFGKYNPIFVQEDVKQIDVDDSGGAYIKTDNSLWIFTYEEGYFIPQKVADNVIDVDFQFNRLLYLTSDYKLYYRNFYDSDKAEVVATDVANIGCMGLRRGMLKRDGSLYMFSDADMKFEKIAENVVAFSGERGSMTGDIAYIDVDGKAFIYNEIKNRTIYITDNAKSIALGRFNLLLKQNGTVLSFESRNGEIVCELDIQNAIDIAADMYSSSVLTADNKIISWGNGRFGQFGYSHGVTTINLDPKAYPRDIIDILDKGYVFTP